MKKLLAIVLSIGMLLSLTSFALADGPVEITLWHTVGFSLER